MKDLIVPTRRGFLAGLGTLLAAPAIVRASSLMPVRDWKTYGSGGRLSMEMITEEMSRLLKQWAWHGSRPVTPTKQIMVDLQLNPADRLLSLEDFSRRILQPAAKCVGDVGVIVGAPREIPEGVEEGALRSNVRGLEAYDICTDSIFTRFDVYVA